MTEIITAVIGAVVAIITTILTTNGSTNKKITDIDSKVGEIKTDVQNVKDDVRTLQRDVGQLKNDMVGVKQRQDAQELQAEKDLASNARRRFLRFADEEKHGMSHTQNHWMDILGDCETYERQVKKFEKGSVEYKNHHGTSTIEYLREMYNLREEKDDFLK